MSALVVSKAVCIEDAKAVLGECPLWSAEKRRLYWLDIKGASLHAYEPETGHQTTFACYGMVSSIALTQGHDLICTHENGFAYLDLVDGQAQLTPINDPEADRPGNRFNDGKIGPDGAYWAGTLENAENNRFGTWWRLLPDGRCVTVDSNYMVTNGPAFDIERARVYLTDSADQTVFAADLDRDGITNKRVFRQFQPEKGYPDGMCVDAEGYLWIAFWDGACVRRFTENGDQVEEIALPVPRPTSLTLVEDKIYVTSARVGLSDEVLIQYPQSGGLFEVQLSRSLEAAGPAIFLPS